MNRPLKFGESLWALVSMALLTTQCGGGSGSRGGPTLSTPCVLAGHQYAFLVTGAGNTNVEATGVMVGGITVAADGSLEGEFDINGGGQNSQPISSGQCSDGTTQNTGTLTLVTPGITRIFNFAMRGSDLLAGDLTEANAAALGAPLAGAIEQQTPEAPFTGNYAFGLVGQSLGPRVAAIGSFCSDANFSLTFLQADTDVSDTLAPALTGTGAYSPPDSRGRSSTGAGGWSLSNGSSLDVTFYVVNSSKAFAIVFGGRTASGATLPAMAGEITGQAGSACPQLTGSFNNSSLANSVFSAKGLVSGTVGAEVGMMNHVNPTSGALTVTSDANRNGTPHFSSDTGATYLVSQTGRATLTSTNTDGQRTQSILYLDGIGNAYLILGQPGTFFGIATPQGTTAAPMTGTYSSGEEFIPPVTTVSGLPNGGILPATEVSLNATAQTLTDLSAGGSSDTYTLGTSFPGRGTATLSNSNTFGDTSIVFYVVSGNQLVTMGLTSATPSIVELRR